MVMMALALVRVALAAFLLALVFSPPAAARLAAVAAALQLGGLVHHALQPRGAHVMGQRPLSVRRRHVRGRRLVLKGLVVVVVLVVLVVPVRLLLQFLRRHEGGHAALAVARGHLDGRHRGGGHAPLVDGRRHALAYAAAHLPLPLVADVAKPREPDLVLGLHDGLAVLAQEVGEEERDDDGERGAHHEPSFAARVHRGGVRRGVEGRSLGGRLGRGEG